MAKTPLSGRRLIGTGILWFAVYFFIILPALSRGLDFSFLNPAAWQKKADDFMTYRWRIETGADWLLLGAMIVWIPMIFIGWWGCYRLPWHKLRKVSLTAPPPARVVRQARLTRKVFVPHAVRGQYGHLQRAQVGEAFSPRSPQAPDETQLKIQDDKADVQLLTELAKPYAADVFPYIVLNGRYASMAISTDSAALMVRVVGGDDQWSVDTQADLDASDWYGEGKTLAAPAADLKQLSRDFKEQEPNSDIQPLMVLARGKLLNAAETAAYLQKNGVLLARLEGVEPADIPLFTDILDQQFQRREGTHALS